MQRHEPIDGLELAQNPYIKEAFESLSRLGFDCVVELGTQNGGFTIFLSKLFKKIISFDNKSFSRTLEAFKKYDNIEFTELDVFKDPQIIGNIIKTQGKVLLLCDNGNKIKEVNIYSNYLKTGDFIMAHDYAKNREYFKQEIRDKYWHCLEITDADIDFNNLFKLDSDIINRAAWFCAIKI